MISKKLTAYVLVTITSITMVGSCDKKPKGNGGLTQSHTNSQDRDVRTPPPLSRDKYTEEYLEKNITQGMTIQDAENILGKPYRISDFMGSIRANYLLEIPSSRDLHFSGFAVVYKDGKVDHIDKEWSSN